MKWNGMKAQTNFASILLPVVLSILALVIMGEPTEKRARFAEVKDAYLAKVVEDAIPQNTKASTAFWLKVFESFCAEKDLSIDLTKCSAQYFNDVLRRFYVSMRTKQGLVYKKSSFLAARAALGRHVTVTLQRPFNVFQKQELQESNRVLDGVLKKNKAEGVEKLIEHTEAIRKADMERLDDYFRNVLTEGDAVKLTKYCWLNLTLHFALRGSEVFNWRRATSSSKRMEKVRSTLFFRPRVGDFMSKNCRSGIDGCSFQTYCRMQEEKQVSAMRFASWKASPRSWTLISASSQGENSHWKTSLVC